MKIYKIAFKYGKDPRLILNKLNGQTFTFFDTETTGLEHTIDQITEIAAITVGGEDLAESSRFHRKIALNQNTLDKIQNQVGSDKPYTIEKNLNRSKYYGLDMPAYEEQEVLGEFKKYVESQGSYLVAHFANFDMKMVGSRVGPMNTRGVWDTMYFARMYYIPALIVMAKNGDEKAEKAVKAMSNAKGKPSSALGSVAQSLGLPTGGWHRAMEDVQTTIGVFRGMTSYINDNAELFDTKEYDEEYRKQRQKQEWYKELDKQKKKSK